jgi:uncharacterized iron-regulated membrane protein
MSKRDSEARRRWPDYAAIWRWHFYAGVLCLSLVFWLAVTGSIYIFRQDIERWLDRPYESLRYEGARQAPSAEVAAAVRAVPASAFSRYELPATPTGAAQIVVSRGDKLIRLYVHPKTLRPLKVEDDDQRIMELVFNLHGNLLLGDKGSIVVEIAASWAIVMLVTGIYLWYPRHVSNLGGVLYPRLGRRGRVFWRDLHAVSGIWISTITLFMLLSGLPWTTSWGTYLSWARSLSPLTSARPPPLTSAIPTWPTGVGQELTRRAAADKEARAEARFDPTSPTAYKGIDRIVSTAWRLNIPRPVWILPPQIDGGDWLVSSQTQARLLRIRYTISPRSGAVTSVQNFSGQNIVDKVVGIAVAAHEGHLLGRLNQAILLLNASGLILLTVCAIKLWWQRRPNGVLGAPIPMSEPRFSPLVAAVIGVLAILLPLFGASLIVVLVIEFAILRRLPRVAKWLGLRSHSVARSVA